jgi:hypothetical protein
LVQPSISPNLFGSSNIEALFGPHHGGSGIGARSSRRLADDRGDVAAEALRCSIKRIAGVSDMTRSDPHS